MANYLICVCIVIVLLFEIVLILKRNKTIEVKGKDDFFTTTIILFLAILLFPVVEGMLAIESFRNTLAFVAIFGSIGVKRGLSDRGIEKLFYTIKWESVTDFYVEEYQVNKVMLRIVLENNTKTLFFPLLQVKSVIKHLQDKGFQVNISETLQV